jgi:hypothetical protein
VGEVRAVGFDRGFSEGTVELFEEFVQHGAYRVVILFMSDNYQWACGSSQWL